MTVGRTAQTTQTRIKFFIAASSETGTINEFDLPLIVGEKHTGVDRAAGGSVRRRRAAESHAERMQRNRGLTRLDGSTELAEV
jgi:hypothetical protein